MRLGLLLLSLASLGAGQVLDELLSARCQAKCLHDFEDAAKENGIRRRTLKHTIINLCKKDATCSACATPCREPFESVSRCKRTACKDTPSKPACVRSCQFLASIFRRRAGSCPSPPPSAASLASVCVAECRRDGDCGAGEKCCSPGCGRRCLPVELRREGGAWLPLPRGVTVEERRRGRSAILRWVLPALLPHQTKTAANLYLIQWRWGLSPEEASMNGWQTVAVRNKLYAILKHLLSPGRHYLFRVAAVNLNGTLGFSQPSRPFRLSRSPRAPGAPVNLNPGRAVLTSSGLMEQEISWEPPKSDLPIVHYQVTWAPAPAPQTSALVQADMPDLSLESEDDDSQFAYHKSTLLPAEANSVELGELRPGVKYLVEVVAIVGSGKREISGDKASLMIQPKLPSLELTTEAFAERTAAPLVGTLDKVRAGKPFFEEGSLKTKLSWRFSGPEGAEFAVSWWPRSCGGSEGAFELSTPQGALSKASSMLLADLKFACSYAVTIAAVAPAEEAGALPETLGRASLDFQTPQCQDAAVEGETELRCPTPAPSLPEAPGGLLCRTKALGAALIGGHCEWGPSADPAQVSSYRVQVSRRTRDGLSERQFVRTVKLRKVVLERLAPGASYRVEVWALGRRGPSQPARADFVAAEGLAVEKPSPEAGEDLDAPTFVAEDFRTDAVVVELDGAVHHVTSYVDSGVAANHFLWSSLILCFSFLFVFR